jgi:hypothetical protein
MEISYPNSNPDGQRGNPFFESILLAWQGWTNVAYSGSLTASAAYRFHSRRQLGGKTKSCRDAPIAAFIKAIDDGHASTDLVHCRHCELVPAFVVYVANPQLHPNVAPRRRTQQHDEFNCHHRVVLRSFFDFFLRRFFDFLLDFFSCFRFRSRRLLSRSANDEEDDADDDTADRSS